MAEKTAEQLAYERSNASLEDYNPSELTPEERVKEWDKRSYRAATPTPQGEAPREPVRPVADAPAGAEPKATTTRRKRTTADD